MSGFDEALRRQEAEQRSADAAQRSQEDQRHRTAEAAVHRITQLLCQFSQRLLERGVPATRFELPAYQFNEKGRAALTGVEGVTTRGLFGKKKFFSPAGYAVGKTVEADRRRSGFAKDVTSLSLITPEGSLWNFLATGYPNSPIARFSLITAAKLAANDIDLRVGNARIALGRDGEALAYEATGGDGPKILPLEEYLAQSALRLINENASQR